MIKCDNSSCLVRFIIASGYKHRTVYSSNKVHLGFTYEGKDWSMKPAKGSHCHLKNFSCFCDFIIHPPKGMGGRWGGGGER